MIVEFHQVMVEIHQVVVEIHQLKFKCYDFTAISDLLQMAANTRATIIELAARVRELSSAIAQSDGIVNGGERSEVNPNNINDIEHKISHLFRPRNTIIEEASIHSSTVRPSTEPSTMPPKSSWNTHTIVLISDSCRVSLTPLEM